MYTVRITTTLGERWGVSDLREEVVGLSGSEDELRREIVEIASCDLERLAMEGEWTVFDDSGCQRCLAREVLFDMLSSLDYMPRFGEFRLDLVASDLAASIYKSIDLLLCEHDENRETVEVV